MRSTITAPDGEQTMYSDRYGEDGRQDFSGTGVVGTIQRPHMGTARKPTFNTTTTTTVAAVASDGSATPAARDALTRTVSELREENGATSASQGTVGLVTTTTTLSAPLLASRTTRVVEDPVARTRVITSPANRVTTIRYDERDRVSTIGAPGTAPITFTYGRGPDGSSRVIETRQASGGRVRTSSWDYAGSSRYPGVQQTRIDSGRRLTTSFGGYSYGAPTTVTTGSEPPVAVDVDESGALRGVTTGAGTTHTMGIDLLGRMTSYAPPGQTATEDPAQCALGMSPPTRMSTISTGITGAHETTGGVQGEGLRLDLVHPSTVPGLRIPPGWADSAGVSLGPPHQAQEHGAVLGRVKDSLTAFAGLRPPLTRPPRGSEALGAVLRGGGRVGRR